MNIHSSRLEGLALSRDRTAPLLPGKARQGKAFLYNSTRHYTSRVTMLSIPALEGRVGGDVGRYTQTARLERENGLGWRRGEVVPVGES